MLDVECWMLDVGYQFETKAIILKREPKLREVVSVSASLRRDRAEAVAKAGSAVAGGERG